MSDLISRLILEADELASDRGAYVQEGGESLPEASQQERDLYEAADLIEAQQNALRAVLGYPNIAEHIGTELHEYCLKALCERQESATDPWLVKMRDKIAREYQEKHRE